MSKKIEAFWQDATAGDVARVMEGETVEARFRDIETDPWCSPRDLTGCKAVGDGKLRWFTLTSSWRYCQVYREPSWWTNKPDPGPGYRLLGKFPDEPKLGTDEAWDCHLKEWHEPCNNGIRQDRVWYRRRIEPVEPKFAVKQMVRVVQPKATDAKHWSEEMNKHIGTASPIKAREKKDDGWFYELGCSAIWAFREDYLEAVEAIEHCSGKPEANIELVAGDTFRHPSGLLFTITEKGFEVTQ